MAKTQAPVPPTAPFAYKRPTVAGSSEESSSSPRATRGTVVAPSAPVGIRPPVSVPAVSGQVVSRPGTPAPTAPLAPTSPRNGAAVGNGSAISGAVINEPVISEPIVNEPVISGPSFLGLNKPADRQTSQSSWGSGMSHDPRDSGNLDYLLEEEEEPKRGWGKLLVIVIALALIGGFGYVRWKQGGFNFLKPTPAAVSAPSASDPASTPGTAATPDVATPDSPPANATTPAQAAASNPADSSPANPTPATPDAGVGAAAPAPPASAPAAGGAEAGTQPAAPPPDAASAQTAADDNTSPTNPPDTTSADKAPAADSEGDSDAEPSKPVAHTQPATAKPSPARTVRERKPTPVTPLDTTAEAERYIYGRGVGQDCDHGLRLLKPAAAQSNPKAMILLGSLYSSGTCTPRDLPTAYRWFALALHKQPDNQPLQDDLQKLWSQMTQPERQLAIKLSQ